MSATVESRLLIAAVALLLMTTLVSFSFRSRQSSRPVILGLSLATSGLFLAAAARWVREEQGPFLTMYDVLLSNVFSLSLIFLVAILTVPAMRATSSVVLPFLSLLGVWALSVPAEAVSLPASFDNPWLWVHVFSGKLFLGICMLAAAAAFMLLLPQPRRFGGAMAARADHLESVVWPAVSAAFVCHSCMLIAGAVWAFSAWGRYWAWDPLETWTFVNWLAMALLLHARATFRRMPSVVGWASVVVVFLLAIATFLGVPFVSMAPHKGVL